MPARLPLVILLWTALAGAQQLEILTARYGAGATWLDVTSRLRGMVAGNRLSLRVDVETLGSDPAPGIAKTLMVRYRFNGREGDAFAGDFSTLSLPPLMETSGSAAPPAPAGGGGFSIGELFGNQPASSPGPAPAPPATSPVPAASAPAVLRIVQARWGFGDRQADVTPQVQALVRDGKVSVKADNKVLGVDPAVGKTKQLAVRYEFGNTTYDVSAKEGATLNLPSSSATPVTISKPAPGGSPEPAAVAISKPPTASGPVAPLGAAPGLRIFYARYGAGNDMADVREKLRPYLQGNQLTMPVTAQILGDPAPGVAKQLHVIYEINGRTWDKVVPDGQSLRIP